MNPAVITEDSAKTSHLFMPENHMENLYASKNPFVRFVHLNRLDSIIHQIPPQDGLRILDAGCGEGHFLERLSRRNGKNHYVGIDITEIALQKAKERCPNAEFQVANLLKTGFDDESFDVVISTEVLEHVHECEAAVLELKRVLKKGGWLIVTFPNESLWTLGRILLGRRPIKVPDHVNSFTPRSMKSRVGLKLVKRVPLPFALPFFLSLGCLMAFEKE